MYRYLAVLTAEAGRLNRARLSRSAVVEGRGGGSVRWRAGVVGGMVGSLFLRSYERSERVYAAMQARGFDGEFRSMGGRPLATADWLAFAVVAAAIVAFVVARPARAPAAMTSTVPPEPTVPPGRRCRPCPPRLRTGTPRSRSTRTSTRTRTRPRTRTPTPTSPGPSRRRGPRMPPRPRSRRPRSRRPRPPRAGSTSSMSTTRIPTASRRSTGCPCGSPGARRSPSSAPTGRARAR